MIVNVKEALSQQYMEILERAMKKSAYAAG
jgi:hypothetical protein